ncbi:MAG: DNA recombination protein RmuC [Candidatus Taylorbacteria bacterium]|nr:DNA recombination protein RmuC [Candidatus Taylorbacteria bacterium]
MESTTLIIVMFVIFFILLVGLSLFVVVLLKKNSKDNKGEDGVGLKLILEQINELNRTMDTKMTENTRHMNESVKNQFSESAKLIKDVTQGLTKLDETNKQVVSFADQLQSLQDILKNPKHRGILGEYYLETLLQNVLAPTQYKMQYPFANGEIVDAAVFVKDKIIPIDSKFSLENYNKLSVEQNPQEKEKLEKAFVNDLKLRIQETSKYIRPKEGTMDFAFMFIPHEAIYYDLLVNKIGAITEETDNLIQRAANKYKVIIVSPTSFLAYLQTVLQGLKAMQIEESAKEIRKNVEGLQKHLKTFEEYQSKLGNALTTTVNHFNNSNKEFKKIDKDVVRITGVESDIELLEVSRPETED